MVSLDELLGFREATERVSGYLNKRLREQLNALSPLLLPGRVFGKHVGARETAPRADEALAELTEKYKQVCVSLPGLEPELDEETLTAIPAAIATYPYEYNYEAKSPKTTRQIAMSSPLRWVAAYGTGGSLSQMRTQLLSPTDRRTTPARQFVVNVLAFQVTLGRSAGAALLLRDLRYEIRCEVIPGLEGLPFTTLGVQLPSFRPSDDLLLTATRLSGVAAFIEVIDPEALRAMDDPFRQQIATLLEEPTE
jgi:hypothetical protein